MSEAGLKRPTRLGPLDGKPEGSRVGWVDASAAAAGGPRWKGRFICSAGYLIRCFNYNDFVQGFRVITMAGETENRVQNNRGKNDLGSGPGRTILAAPMAAQTDG